MINVGDTVQVVNCNGMLEGKVTKVFMSSVTIDKAFIVNEKDVTVTIPVEPPIWSVVAKGNDVFQRAPGGKWYYAIGTTPWLSWEDIQKFDGDLEILRSGA